MMPWEAIASIAGPEIADEIYGRTVPQGIDLTNPGDERWVTEATRRDAPDDIEDWAHAPTP